MRNEQNSHLFRTLLTILGSLLTIIGFVLVWLGFKVTTCTMCDTDSVITGMVLSTPVYTIAALSTWFGRPTLLNLIFMPITIPALVYQIYVAAKISYIALLNGCICAAYHPYLAELGSYHPTLKEYVTGPILIFTACTLIFLVVLKTMSITRHQQTKY